MVVVQFFSKTDTKQEHLAQFFWVYALRWLAAPSARPAPPGRASPWAPLRCRQLLRGSAARAPRDEEPMLLLLPAPFLALAQSIRTDSPVKGKLRAPRP